MKHLDGPETRRDERHNQVIQAELARMRERRHTPRTSDQAGDVCW
jgi:hypothetical protein